MLRVEWWTFIPAMVERRVYFHAKLQTFQAMKMAFFEMARAPLRGSAILC